LEEDGYVSEEVGDTRLAVSSRDGGETGRIEAFIDANGQPYLLAHLDDESVPLGPSDLRAALHECLAPWEPMPLPDEPNLP
jgi:hypothetical protein